MKAGIAVSGAAGTGKTTLARALAVRLELPYLEEGMRRRLEAGLDVHGLDTGQRKDLAEELLDEMIRDARAARREQGGFVSDRCTLDLAAFWIYYGFGFDAARTERYVRRAGDAMDLFSLVVVAPRDVFPLEDDGVRTANPWIQMHFEAVLSAFLVGSPVPVMTLPAAAGGLEQRVQHVLERVAPDGTVPGATHGARG